MRPVQLIGLGLAGVGVMFFAAAGMAAATGVFFTPPTDTGTPLAALDTIAKTKQQDPQLAPGGPFVADQEALVALGKAFFWDQQAGSDGQACGSCHFSAGADGRTRNLVSPGLKATPPDKSFELGGFHAPNSTLTAGELPSHKLANINDRNSAVRSDSNDTVGSPGVFFRSFVAVPDSRTQTFGAPRPTFGSSRGADTCVSQRDPNGFQVDDVNVRAVEPRNTPTVFNALFNNRNFWDGRAQDIFNGASPFGARDTNASVYTLAGRPTTVRITFASLASQAVGPPTNNIEMSCDGRTFPDVGHKLLQVDPLALQQVDPDDSVLGRYSNAGAPPSAPGASPTTLVTQNRDEPANGLNVDYDDLIRKAFNQQWWAGERPLALKGKSYSQMEANFSLFWGLAVKAYMETLVADRTPVDQFLAGNTGALSPSARQGLNIFQSFQGFSPNPTNPSSTIPVKLSTDQPADARCITCHGGAPITNASITNVQGQRLERMNLRDGRCAIYDQGFLNTGVRRPGDDPAVAGFDPFNNSFAETFLAQQGTLTTRVPGVPQDTAPYGLNVTADPNVTGPALGGSTNCEFNNINAAFKAPQLRNVELTGPYFHNGGQLTLMQVVDFYNRGGDFDNPDIDDNLHNLGLAEQDKKDLVAFLLALTDERVAFERAPFDHPSICVANGQVGTSSSVQVGPPLPGGGPQAIAVDQRLCINATGARGRQDRLPRFLNADPYTH
jgi:cytochrome c peroxidase